MLQKNTWPACNSPMFKGFTRLTDQVTRFQLPCRIAATLLFQDGPPQQFPRPQEGGPARKGTPPAKGQGKEQKETRLDPLSRDPETRHSSHPARSQY
ncbi:hypothetical protein TNIN_173821 [Trichonephila inaurata madagascariensis]|uniref:Uncharacterized protein n=1 Tax=Trichonephila inaurata madagascariensis TaxID=2747483 RepID=A0A8X6IWZ4_9ARAC|nr:hypothetical protein TNIN_173821 [Trichonephila inaurata madagascariensis]